MTVDSVTLQQAMADAGTGDVGQLSHSIGKVAPGIPSFDPDLPADVWDKVKAAVKAHVALHADPRNTVHALPGGVERVTRGPLLTDPVLFEG